MSKPLSLVCLIVMIFIGFMMGYSVPPFMEVGFQVGVEKSADGVDLSEDIMDQYKKLYEDEDEE